MRKLGLRMLVAGVLATVVAGATAGQASATGCDCSFTIGFFKNHESFTTRYLPQWLGTEGGAESIYLSTFDEAYAVLTLYSDASNGINKLYAQLLAAKLNLAHGADGTVVADTIADADAFLADHGSDSWSGLSQEDRQLVLGWAETLDEFNNGLIGPGPCQRFRG